MQPVLIMLHQGFQLQNTRRSRDFYDSEIISDQSLKKHLSLRGIDGNSGPVYRMARLQDNVSRTQDHAETFFRCRWLTDRKHNVLKNILWPTRIHCKSPETALPPKGVKTGFKLAHPHQKQHLRLQRSGPWMFFLPGGLALNIRGFWCGHDKFATKLPCQSGAAVVYSKRS